jgi:hypothetical protein
MLTTTHNTPLQARALDNWREAADAVAFRWDKFLEADGAARSRAFAAFVTALDDEEAAAAELAALTPADMAA